MGESDRFLPLHPICPAVSALARGDDGRLKCPILEHEGEDHGQNTSRRDRRAGGRPPGLRSRRHASERRREPGPSPSATRRLRRDGAYPAPCLLSVQVTPTCVEDVPAVSYNVRRHGAGRDDASTSRSRTRAARTSSRQPAAQRDAAARRGHHRRRGSSTGRLDQHADGAGPGVTGRLGPPGHRRCTSRSTPTPTPGTTRTPTAQVLTVDADPAVTPVDQVLAEGDPTPSPATPPSCPPRAATTPRCSPRRSRSS